jgi:hypothetical protein
MYLPEGSCAPKAPLIGGPPGIPGNPFPADPNDFPMLELAFAPVSGVTAGAPEGTAPTEADAAGGASEEVGAG